MSWKFVFNTKIGNKTWSLSGALEAAACAGYKFILWNDDVLFIVGSASYHDTGIGVEDLY